MELPIPDSHETEEIPIESPIEVEKEETWDKLLSVESVTLAKVESFVASLRQLFQTAARDVAEVTEQKQKLEEQIAALQLADPNDNAVSVIIQGLKVDCETLSQQIRLYDDLSRNVAEIRTTRFDFTEKASPNSQTEEARPHPQSRRVQSQTSELMFESPEAAQHEFKQDKTELEHEHVHDYSPPESPFFSNSQNTPQNHPPLQQAYYSAATFICAFREILSAAQKRQLESQRLCRELLSTESDVLAELCLHIALLPPQGQSSVGSIFKFLFENHKDGSTNYILSRPGLLTLLIDGYAAGFCGHATGSILRQCARQPVLCDLIHKSPSFIRFFDYVQVTTFELASDAFSSFNLCLTRHPAICAKWLLANFDLFFVEKWGRLLLSRTYVTQRQALTLLRQILNNRSFYHVMMKYISTKKCLEVIVNLVTAKKIKEGIRMDSFHVLKIFVQNPRKTPEIAQTLAEQSAKLIKGLGELSPTIEMEKVQDILEKLQKSAEQRAASARAAEAQRAVEGQN